MIRKLIHIRSRNQITLPAELISLWNVEPGDYLRAYVGDDGRVSIAPAHIAVEGSPEAAEQNRQADEDIKAGRYRTFSDVDSFVQSLGEKDAEAEGERQGVTEVTEVTEEPVYIKEQEEPERAAEETPVPFAQELENALLIATLHASNWNRNAAKKRILEGLEKINIERESDRVR